MAQAERTIWLVGPFPPPLHGQAVYNAAFSTHLRQHGALRILSTGDSAASKLAGYSRIVLVALFRIRRRDVVYTSMPGQMAAWLFALVVAALRLRGIDHFVHHHSYRSIVLGPLGVMRAVVGVGGRRQRHILLSPIMRDRFAALYLDRAGGRTAYVLSNALLFCPDVAVVTSRPPRPRTLGHLSVLSRDKGVDTLISLFRRAALTCSDLRLILAGPIADETLGTEIAAAIAEFPGRIEHRGPISGTAKQRFYADIDLFLLPTRLIDEAEPLVMLESYAAGVDFMATNRGCIAERIRRPDRLLTGDESVDTARILSVIDEDADDWNASRRECNRHALDLHASGVREAALVFDAMFAPR